MKYNPLFIQYHFNALGLFLLQHCLQGPDYVDICHDRHFYFLVPCLITGWIIPVAQPQYLVSNSSQD